MACAYLWYTLFAVTVCTAYGGFHHDCCKDAAQMCKFICNDPFSGSFIDNLACARERVKIMTCGFRNASGTHDIPDYIDGLSDQLKQVWEDIPDQLKTLLSDQSRIGEVPVEQLTNLRQDLISQLKTVVGMTSEQFVGMVDRLQDFNPDNLEGLLDNMNITVIFTNFTKMGITQWNKLQLEVLARKAYDEFGDEIGTWTGSQLMELGNVIAGIPSHELRKINPQSFNESLQMICDVDLSLPQRLDLMHPLYKTFGDDIARWDGKIIKRLCQFLVGLNTESFKQIKAEEIIKSLGVLQEHVSQKETRDAIVEKVKGIWGDIATWNTDQLKNFGSFVNNINVSDIENLRPDQLSQVVKELNLNVLDKVQVGALAEKIAGTVQKDPELLESIMQKGGDLLQYVHPSVLEGMSKSMMAFAEKSQFVKWNQDQADYIVHRIRQVVGMQTLSTQDLVKLNSVLIAFLTSDFAMMARKAIYPGIPSLGFTLGIAEPVIRYFIAVYRMESPQGEIKNLGQFARALTRQDLEDEMMSRLLLNMDALKYIYFDKTQQVELLRKLVNKFGDVRKSEDFKNDIPAWGFQNVKKMGTVILGLSREQLLNYPLHSLESVIEVLGKHDEWERREVLAVINRMRQYWDAHQISIDNLKEADVEALGKFLQGLTLEELKRIPDETKNVVWQTLGNYTGLPRDKLEERAKLAYEEITKMSSGKLNSTGVKIMGNLLAGLSTDMMLQIDADVIMNNLYAFVKEDMGMPFDNLRVVFDKMKEATNVDLNHWSADQWRRLGIALQTMRPEELMAINSNSFRLLLDLLGSFGNFTESQVDVIVPKIKEIYGADVSEWSSNVFKKMGSFINVLRASDIYRMDETVVRDIIGFVGHAVNIPENLNIALAKRFKEIFLQGDMSKLNASMAKRIRNILSGFDIDDLRKIDISTVDLLAELGDRQWSPDQVNVLINGVQHLLSSDNQTYMYLKNIVKGYGPEDIKAIPEGAFRLAAGIYGKITTFTPEQKEAFAEKAKQAWLNDVSKWTAAVVSEAGQFIDGLVESDLSKIQAQSIYLIPDEVIGGMAGSLTGSQLYGMSQRQARSISKQQMSSLPSEKVKIISSIILEEADVVDYSKQYVPKSMTDHSKHNMMMNTTKAGAVSIEASAYTMAFTVLSACAMLVFGYIGI